MLEEYFGLSVLTAFCQMRHSLTGECLLPFMLSNYRVSCNLRPFSTVWLSFKLSLLKIETRIGLTTSISQIFFSSLLFLVYFRTGHRKVNDRPKYHFPLNITSFPFLFSPLSSFLPPSLPLFFLSSFLSFVWLI